jgi:hypothetical protein
LEQNKGEWKTVFDDAEPQTSKFPAPWSEKLSEFQTVLVIRCIQPDRVVPALQNFVKSMKNLLSGYDLNGTVIGQIGSARVVSQ